MVAREEEIDNCMVGSPKINAEAEGVLLYENWKAALRGNLTDDSDRSMLFSTVEYPLFSDARIVGELNEGFAPYRVFNTVSNQVGFKNAPAMVLRVDFVLQKEITTETRTDTSRYHGGNLNDELAALISLLMGIRLKSGGMNRFFDGRDPKGHPIEADFQEDPNLPPPPRVPVLSSAVGEHSLEDAMLLKEFPRITPEQSVALVRASRLYQDAVWIIESEPALSWVMLVSAVEAAAGSWRDETDTPIERMRWANEDFARLLVEYGGQELEEKAAKMVSGVIGAGRKFRTFLLNFLPPPPTLRPPEVFQHQWTQEELTKSFKIIYGHRSKALHAGTPFPYPMCMRPYGASGEAPSERPVGIAMSSRGSTWAAEDAPMHIHVFEYIVRRSLISWFKSMLK